MKNSNMWGYNNFPFKVLQMMLTLLMTLHENIAILGNVLKKIPARIFRVSIVKLNKQKQKLIIDLF